MHFFPASLGSTVRNRYACKYISYTTGTGTIVAWIHTVPVHTQAVYIQSIYKHTDYIVLYYLIEIFENE